MNSRSFIFLFCNQGYTQQQIAEAIYFLDVADNDYLSLIEESLDFDVSTAVSEVISSMKESLEVSMIATTSYIRSLIKEK